MKKIDMPLLAKDLTRKFLTSSIYFVIQSQKKQSTLKVKKYKNIEEDFEKDKVYHELYENYPKKYGFIKAKMYGFSERVLPTNIMDYNDYSYFFNLSANQLNSCLFESRIKGKTNIGKGIEGLVEAIKDYNKSSSNEEKDLNKEIEIIIPFNIEFDYFIDKKEKRNLYFCSSSKIDKLDKYTLVSGYKSDAIKFSINWNSSDLLSRDQDREKLGRPPEFLVFKRSSHITDHKVYLYKLTGVNSLAVSKNEQNPWNRITLENISLENKKLKHIKTYKSWKKALYDLNEEQFE